MAFRLPKLLLPCLMTTISLFLSIPYSTQLSFNYTDFSEMNNETIKVTENVTISDSCIQLTPDAVDNWGRAIYPKPLRLWEKHTGKVANFTTRFSFIIYKEVVGNYSSGLTFFLASPNLPRPMPTDGAGLGLASRPQVGDPSFLAENKFVAVEFDTFWNSDVDPPDYVGEDVGIDVNSLVSQNATPWKGFVKQRRAYTARVTYDSSMQNLSVTFTGFANSTTPIEQHLSSSVNLTDHLPEWVEFGLSASTGLRSSMQILCSWSRY